MPTTQGVLSIFVFLLSFTSALREGKKVCSSKCHYDPFVIFGLCNGVDLQLDPTISARNPFSGCATCDKINLKDLGAGNNNGHEPVNNGFPACLPASIDILRLSGLQVSRLKGALFDTLPNLRYLYVINGTVDSIEPGTFANISRLNTLAISGNKLSRLACGWFDGLHSLEILRIRENRLSLIDEGAFQNLTALRFLGLAQNLLIRLEREYFEGLSTVELIDLNHNKIEAIEPGTFKPCPFLMALLLSGNRLTVLAEGWSEGLGNLMMVLTMSDNTFRCMCSSAWIPEYLSVLSAIPGVNGDAVCQFPPEQNGEAISETLLQRLPPCLPPKVTVSAQNGGQAFTCDVYWEEEPNISWQLPGSLVLTVHVPRKYPRTSRASSLTYPANITARVIYINVSLEGWAFPCVVPNVNESVNSTACGNFFGKATSLLVIGQSQAVRWNYQAVHCVASFSQGSAMNNVTASAVISVEEPLVEEVTTKNGQDTSRTTDMTLTTTMVLSFLLGESTLDNNKEVYIWISVACAAALVGLWGYLLIAKFWCDHTDDSTSAEQSPDHSKEESTDVSDHEYATIKDEDDSDVLRENQYEEIRDDVTSSAYIHHGQRSSVHLENNRESRKPNPFYTFNKVKVVHRGLYTISENDTAAEEPSEDDDVLGIAEGPSSDGSGGSGGMSGSAEGTSRDGDATDTGMSGSAEGPSEAAGISGSAKGPSEAAGVSGRAEGTSRNSDATDTGISAVAEGPSGDGSAEDSNKAGSAEGTSQNDHAKETGMSSDAVGPSGYGDVGGSDQSGGAKRRSGDGSTEDTAGMSSAKYAGMPSAEDAGMSSAKYAGMPSAKDAGMSSAKDAGMPSAKDARMPSAEDTGMPSAEDAGMPSAEDAGMPSTKDAGVSSGAEMPSGNSNTKDGGLSGVAGALSEYRVAEDAGISCNAERPPRNNSAVDSGILVTNGIEDSSIRGDAVDCFE
uniref:Ig-like domain-containing protein n=1 Tax=Branchiostoma floridae TaxID=7739 RepID=C3ZAC2_BRAFL|eukprot:XP_002594504.1 hypothetical protein BRAFLDRAFT_87696 [Branchiostoma floridae]